MKYLSLDGVNHLWSKIKSVFIKQSDALTYEEIQASTDLTGKVVQAPALINALNYSPGFASSGEGNAITVITKYAGHAVIWLFLSTPGSNGSYGDTKNIYEISTSYDFKTVNVARIAGTSSPTVNATLDIKNRAILLTFSVNYLEALAMGLNIAEVKGS